MQLQAPFDATKTQMASPDGGGTLPVGNHPAIISGSPTYGDNSDKQTGGHVKFPIQIIDGPHRGQSGVWVLNLYHTGKETSAKTIEIAYQQLAALCYVTGVPVVQDLDALMNKPFQIVVEPQGDPQHPNRTQIKGVLDVNGDIPGKPGVKGVVRQAAPAPAPGAAAPVWQPPAPAAGAPSGFAPSPAQQSFGPAPAQQPQQPQQPAQPVFGAPAAAPGFAPFQPAAAPQQPQQPQQSAGWPGAAAVVGGAPAGPVPNWAQRPNA